VAGAWLLPSGVAVAFARQHGCGALGCVVPAQAELVKGLVVVLAVPLLRPELGPACNVCPQGVCMGILVHLLDL
jgi:predicted transcriptional regulator